MNTAILILVLFLFGLVIVFTLLWAFEKYKARERLIRQRINKLTKKANLIENKVEILGSTGEKKQANIKAPNVFNNMEDRKVKELKHVVVVNDKEKRVG
jgi:uncharacterized protein (DUF2147 family)